MKTSIRTLLLAAITAAALQAVSAAPAFAQMPSRHGQPKTPFGTADFAKARWLEGSWAGTSTDENPVYEKVHFLDDSTADITYYRDANFQQETGQGRLYLSVGRVFHTFGPSRWAASHVDTDEVFFVPQSIARNTYAWTYKSPDAWTSTMRTGVSGHERVIVYEMKRVK